MSEKLISKVGRAISHVFSLAVLFSLLNVLSVQQTLAATLKPSTGLPGADGADVHMYVVHNRQNTVIYWRSDIKPTQTTDFGRFAFYKVDPEETDESLSNAYYIYDCSTGQWLTYTVSEKYHCQKGDYADCEHFVGLSDEKVDGAYFFISPIINGYYQIAPALKSGKAATKANGNPSDCYINFYGGASKNPDNTLGLWFHSGLQDDGSAWMFEEPSGGCEIEASTIPVDDDTRISKVYSIHNGYGSGVASTLYPSADDDGHFALQKADGVDNAYYIYDYSAQKWLYYTRQSDYSTPTKDFVTLDDEKKEYFNISSIGNGYYEIRPYTTNGSVASVYLNYYLGVALNKTNTIGYYLHDGKKDAGSRWLFAEVSPTAKTISEESDLNTYGKEGDLTVTLTRSLGSGWWNTFCVPFNISKENVEAVFGADCQIREFTGVSDDGKTLLFTATDNIVAGQPYLIRPAATVTNPTFSFVNIGGGSPEPVEHSGYKMVGIYGKTSLRKGGLDLFLGDGDRFYKPSDDSQLKGLRAYFQVPENTKASSLRALIDDQTTGITAVDGEKPNALSPVYNLQGQCVGTSLEALPSGIYIQNGRKMVVK